MPNSPLAGEEEMDTTSLDGIKAKYFHDGYDAGKKDAAERLDRIIVELVRNDGFYGGALNLSDEDMDYVQAIR